MQVKTQAPAVTPQTNRIVVPATDEYPEQDEVTVVRPRAEPISLPRAPVTVASNPPSEAADFNPVKILIPAAAALLVVFAVVYAFTRSSETGTNSNQPQQTLMADPNSQPVEPAQPATGKGEIGVPAGGVINANKNLNANAQVSPTPIEEINLTPSPNVNENVNANADNNRKAPPVPNPSRTVSPEDVPPAPSPTGTKTPAPKPSPVPPVASPTTPPK
jgi:hypothetical protein